MDDGSAIVTTVAETPATGAVHDAAAKTYATQDAKNRAPIDRADGRSFAIYAVR